MPQSSNLIGSEIAIFIVAAGVLFFWYRKVAVRKLLIMDSFGTFFLGGGKIGEISHRKQQLGNLFCLCQCDVVLRIPRILLRDLCLLFAGCLVARDHCSRQTSHHISIREQGWHRSWVYWASLWCAGIVAGGSRHYFWIYIEYRFRAFLFIPPIGRFYWHPKL